MNVFKLVACDIREGIFKNKRYIIVPILCLLECLYAHMVINSLKEYNNIHSKTTIFDLFTEIFYGCDPISMNPSPDTKIELPYFWIAIFIFAVFISFDYIHNDLTQFGLQILTRSKKRSLWWHSKCIWCLASSICFYIIFLLTALIFCIINGYSLYIESTSQIINLLGDRSVVYSFIGISELSVSQRLWILLAPLAVIYTLNMIQMILCLFMKPMYSYLIIIGLLMISVLTDAFIAFPRCGMVVFNDWFFKNGYNLITGLIICLILILLSVVIGEIYFKRYDILPDKE